MGRGRGTSARDHTRSVTAALCRAKRGPYVRAATVRLEQTDEGADAAIEMTSEGGTRAVVRFQSPICADLLDPAVE